MSWLDTIEKKDGVIVVETKYTPKPEHGYLAYKTFVSWKPHGMKPCVDNPYSTADESEALRAHANWIRLAKRAHGAKTSMKLRLGKLYKYYYPDDYSNVDR